MNFIENIAYKGNRIVGVFLGNEFRNDDGVGPYIAKKINNPKIKVINAEQTFENYIFDIIEFHPTDVIVVDAAFFGGRVGEIRILDEKKLSQVKMVSTHSLPLNLLIDMIRSEIADVNFIIIGIQISNVDYGEKISDDVRKSADVLVEFFNKI